MVGNPRLALERRAPDGESAHAGKSGDEGVKGTSGHRVRVAAVCVGRSGYPPTMTMVSRLSHALAGLGLILLASCASAEDLSSAAEDAASASTDGSGADAERGTPAGAPTRAQPAPDGCTPDEPTDEAPAAHVEVGTTMDYEGVPPVSGTHWSRWPDITEVLYDADDRPELGELVHSQEHGWTFVWYDESIAGDEQEMTDLTQVARQIGRLQKTAVVPWTSADGQPFPTGAHVAITHWSATRAGGGTEWRQYCGQPELDVVLAFVDRHPYTDAHEPDGP